MLFKKVKYCCAVFVLSVVLLSSTAALALASYQSGMDIYKEKPKISGEAVDFLTKTGQALAEVAEAVKPAIVNISTVRTEKIMGRDRKSTRLNSSHTDISRMPSSA